MQTLSPKLFQRYITYYSSQTTCPTLLPMLLSVLPSLVAFYLTDNTFWIHIALFSASLFYTQHQLQWRIIPTVIHGLLVVGCIIVTYALKEYIWMFALAVALIVFITFLPTYYNSQFRILCAWTIIPTVYIACELTPNEVTSLTSQQFINYLSIDLTGGLLPLIILFTTTKSRNAKSIFLWPASPFSTVTTTTHPLFFSCGLFFIVYASAAVIGLFHINHGEWLIWSSISVSTGEINSIVVKFRQRAVYSFTGLIVGSIILLLLPSFIKIHSLWELMVPISLIFPHYGVSFGCRNLFTALSAGSFTENHLLDMFRMGNVLWGGLMGVTGGYIILLTYQKFFQSKKNNKVSD